MKADYVHKDSKTINDEIVSYKITMPLTNNEELQRIDNNYNELVDEFTKQYTKEKDMIVAQRIMMNLRKENKKLHIENQKLKEMQCIFLGTGCQNKIKEYKIQQREFIDWLGSLVVSDLDVFTEIKVCDVLSKYKEIIGGKDE